MSATKLNAQTSERVFLALLKQGGIPDPMHEFRFADLQQPPRRWRFDYSWPASKVALEVEGGAFVRGRHTRGVGFKNDLEKYNTATALGWRLLRVTPDDLTHPQTITWIQQALQHSQPALSEGTP